MNRQIGSETRQMRRARERDQEKEENVSEDIRALLRNDRPKEINISYQGAEYIFMYKDVPWGSYLKHIEASWYQIDGQDKFNLEQYYEDMLLDSLLSFPGGGNPTRSILKQFQPEVFFQLQTIIPKPSFGGELEETKKESMPSLVEEEILETADSF